MNKYLILVTIFNTLISVGCKYDCPGFPQEEIKWIPFEQTDIFYFSNGMESMEYVVTDYFQSGSSHFRGIAMDYDCQANGFYKATSNYSEIYEERTIGYGNNMHVEIENEIFEFSIYQKKSFEDSITVSFIEDTIINEIKYNEVFVVEKDTININPQIAYFLKAANEGIIEYYDFQNKKIWKKMNK